MTPSRNLKIREDIEVEIEMEGAIERFREAISKFANDLSELLEELRKIFDKHTEIMESKRYRPVKKFSKAHGINQDDLWKKTRIFRIRSDC